MSNGTRAFLGDQAQWHKAQIEFNDVHGLWGGRQIVVHGDGRAKLRIVDRTGREETHQLDIQREAMRILELCAENDILSVPFPNRPLVPDEVCIQVTLTNGAGEPHPIMVGSNGPQDPRFIAVSAALLDIEKNRERYQPRPSDPILDAIGEFLTRQNWVFTHHPTRPVLRMSFTGKNGSWQCFAQSRRGDTFNQLLFYSVCPINCPVEKRQAIAEYVTRANYGMAIGNFELDYSDGEIRYKTSVDVGDSQLTSYLMKPVVYRNVLMMDQYLPGIMAVVYGNMSPADAVAQAESSNQ